MEFNQALTLGQQSKFSEGSALAPNRDDRNNSLLWKKSRNESAQLASLSEGLQKVSREVAKQKRRIVGGGTIPTQQMQYFLVVSDGGDYYNCNTWDGQNAGMLIVKVAKNQDLLCILPTASPAGGAWPQKTIRGITYTYVYTPTAGATTDGVNVIEYVRSVTGSDASSETDNVTPCLNIGDIITGFSTSFTTPATLNGVIWQALTDGRAWAAQPTS